MIRASTSRAQQIGKVTTADVVQRYAENVLLC